MYSGAGIPELLSLNALNRQFWSLEEIRLISTPGKTLMHSSDSLKMTARGTTAQVYSFIEVQQRRAKKQI